PFSCWWPRAASATKWSPYNECANASALESCSGGAYSLCLPELRTAAPGCPDQQIRSYHMSKTAIFGLVFVLAACSAAILLDRPPAPVAASAPPTEFSAERATVYLDNFAWRPHPIGTGEHDRVRD